MLIWFLSCVRSSVQDRFNSSAWHARNFAAYPGASLWLPVPAPTPHYSYNSTNSPPWFYAFALCTSEKFLKCCRNVLSFILLAKSSSFFKAKVQSYESNDSRKSSLLPLRFCITSCVLFHPVVCLLTATPPCPVSSGKAHVLVILISLVPGTQ